MTAAHVHARALQRLEAIIDGMPSIAVAVSGGVDSLTLATLAGRRARTRAEMFHAVSAAVPVAATERVRALAEQERWTLHLIRPGELERPDYVANPVDRCLHCKRALYTTILPYTRSQVVSGANLDDLGDYRPGLEAARESGVRHPFVEAGVDKATVRGLAAMLGLGAIAELPASPCLSSRVETGIAIDATTLGKIDAAENVLRVATGAAAVRCRVRQAGIVIEIDGKTLSKLSPVEQDRLGRRVGELFELDAEVRPAFTLYRMGSAFLRIAT